MFPFYGVMIFIAIVANIIVTNILSCKYNYSIFEYINLVLYEMIGIIVGAKFFTYFTQYNNYNEFNIFSIGMSSYGAIIGAIIMIFIFSFIYNKSLKELLYIIIPPIPLLYGIGKIGCFLAGCCRGFVYNGFGSVTYKYVPNADTLSYFPVQLVEAITFILFFMYLIIIIRKNKFNNLYIGKTFVICGLFKFLLDFFRISHSGKVLSINQVFSLVFILIGLIIIIVQRKTKIKTNEKQMTSLESKKCILLALILIFLMIIMRKIFPINLVVSFLIINYMSLRNTNKLIKILYYLNGFVCFVIMIMAIMHSMSMI